MGVQTLYLYYDTEEQWNRAYNPNLVNKKYYLK